MNEELIPEKMPGRKVVLQADLDAAQETVGVSSYYIGLPIYKMHDYVPPPGVNDGYGAVRKWYRANIAGMNGVYIIHKVQLLRGLTRAQPDALEYLTVEDEAERAKHEEWLEPGNEAIEIAQWIFPANALNNAIVPSNFQGEIVIVSVRRNDKEIDRVYYFMDPHSHAITYSHHYRGRKIVPQGQQ